MARWCRTHRWVDRVAAWDAEQHRKTLIELDKPHREMIERHTRVGRVILSKVAQRLIGDEVAGVSALAPSALTPSDIARLFEVAVKMNARAEEFPTPSSESNTPPGHERRRRPRVHEGGARQSGGPASGVRPLGCPLWRGRGLR